MKIIDKVIAQIEENRYSGSSEVLALALASACNSTYKISLLDVSVKLDADNQALVFELARISKQPDVSNADQSAALKWLKAEEFI